MHPRPWRMKRTHKMAEGLAMPKEKQATTQEIKRFSAIRQLKPLEFGSDPTGKYNLLHARRKLALE